MAELFRLFELRDAALEEYETHLKIAEEEYPKENVAIVHLQRVFRGSVARDRIYQKRWDEYVNKGCFANLV